jgi:site-specific DNA recombinase
LVLAEKLGQIDRPQYTFEDLLELAMRVLSSPWNIWQTGHLNLRRMGLRLAFAERITYSRKDGFSNVKTSLPFSILKEIYMQKNEVARPKGFEPLTLRFVV